MAEDDDSNSERGSERGSESDGDSEEYETERSPAKLSAAQLIAQKEQELRDLKEQLERENDTGDEDTKKKRKSSEKRKYDSDDENDDHRKSDKKIHVDEEEDDIDLPPISVSMTCPQYKIGGIIGKRGMVISEIISKSGCRIEIDKTNIPEGVPRQIELVGRPKQINIAMAMITQIINTSSDHFANGGGNTGAGGKPYTSYQGGRPPAAEYGGRGGGGAYDYSQAQPASFDPHANFDESGDFLCPQSKVGLVIGQKGANVNDIFHRTGCKIQIEHSGPLVNGSDRIVTFTGTPSQVAEAKALVRVVISTPDAPGFKTAGGPPAHERHYQQREYQSYGGRGGDRGGGGYGYGSGGGGGRGGGGGYGAPPAYGGGGYGAPGGYPPASGGYGAPPSGGYGAPASGGYGYPPAGGAGGYGYPPAGGGYGAPASGGYPPAAGGYGAPAGGGYGAPAGGGYGAPATGGYGAPPVASGGYGAPAGGGYGANPYAAYGQQQTSSVSASASAAYGAAAAQQARSQAPASSERY